jgi:endonuclease YncB( thermonuclease family)
MKRFAGFVLMFFACSAAVAVPARVGYVVDGDTFSGIVKLDGGAEVSVRVRLRNVDTPEIHGECEYERQMAARARERLSEMLPVGAIVELTNIKDDKYLGRIDANVIDSRGRDIGAQLVSEGLGRRYNGGRRQTWCSGKK